MVSYSVEGPATGEEGASIVLALLGVGPVAGVYPDLRKGKATSEALGLASWAIAADAGMFSGMKNLQKILCKSLKAFSGLEDRAEDASSMLLANSTGTGPAMSSPSKREALMGHSRSCTVIAVSLDRYGLGLCIGGQCTAVDECGHVPPHSGQGPLIPFTQGYAGIGLCTVGSYAIF